MTPSFSVAERPQSPPTATTFPGVWEKNIYAPASRTVSPKTILSLPSGSVIENYGSQVSINTEDEGLVFDFGIEVGGIVTVAFELMSASPTTLGLAFTEAKNYIGRESDSSNGGTGRDGALLHSIDSPGLGSYTMPRKFLRGGFRYLTLFLLAENTSVLKISSIKLEITYQPTWSNLRAYQGYFHSSDELLNQIWYAGAYTLQTNSVSPDTGRISTSDRPGWHNDECVGPGDSVLLDGAKRDRWVWIGDMGVAVTSAFVSTGDLVSTKYALLAIYDNQIFDGALPKAGPPYSVADSDTYHLWTLIGTFNYFLYSGDQEFLSLAWPKYLKAMTYSLNKLNSRAILSVTGVADWGRFTYGNERASASMLLVPHHSKRESHPADHYKSLFRALCTGAKLATWASPQLPEAGFHAEQWSHAATVLQAAIMKELWDARRGAFKDSPENTDLYPQDANSMALAFNVLPPDSQEAQKISHYLESNWTPIGASCPELPKNISPFISSIEIQGHFNVGRADRAIKLIRDGWGWYLRNPNGTESTVPEGYLVDGSWGYRGDRGYRNDPSYVSHAHGWSSGPTSVLTEHGVGLRITKPQGSEWQLQPLSFLQITQAQAGFTTGNGKYSASYKYDGKVLEIEWDTPEKSKGFVIPPHGTGRWVRGGKGSLSIHLTQTLV